jgi:hypothetical protein
MNGVRFTVTNGDNVNIFPLDMLRYDQCWPASEWDTLAIQDAITAPELGAQAVTLVSNSEPDPERWQSFGWQIITTKPPARRTSPVPRKSPAVAMKRRA